MEARGPLPLIVPISRAPSKAPCPTCGKLGRLKQVLHRTVRTLAYRRVAYLEITLASIAPAARAAPPSAPTHRASTPAPDTTTRSAKPSSTASSTTA